MPTMFQLKRCGYFIARFSSPTNQCGREGQPLFRYHCIITAGDHLDSRGFIIDNHDIQKYFDARYAQATPSISCENIAKNACYALGRQLLDADVDLRYIEVTIIGGPNTQVACNMAARDILSTPLLKTWYDEALKRKPPQPVRGSDVWNA